VTLLYRSLLRLYPRRHRSAFDAEMIKVFCEAKHDAAQMRFSKRSRFYLREVLGLIGGAARERFEGSQFQAECAASSGGTMDRRLQCHRFPRTAIVMMTLVFLIAVELIAKGEGLSRYLFHTYALNGTSQGWDLGRSVSHWPAHYGLLSGVLAGFAIAWLVGVLAWAIAYAMRKAGVQRLDDFETWSKSQ
jgi:hypothetical protein